MWHWLNQVISRSRLLREINEKLDRMEVLMSALSDKIAELGVKVDDAIAREGTEDAAEAAEKARLQAKIDELQALVDAGGASQADLDALDALKAKLDQINPA